MNPTQHLLSLPLAQTASAQEADASSLWSMIQQGGWAMAPLALCSLALIYLAIHCYRETRPGNFTSPQLSDQVSQQLEQERLAEASQLAQASPTALGRSLSAAFPKFDPRRPDESLASVETEVAATLELEENAVAQWIHYMSVIANVAPMVGLLGTVSGMIGGFQTMSAGGMGRPELFAGDIGEALITTATGLCIGIPAMIAHSYFNNRLNNLLVDTSRQASQALSPLSHPNPARS